MSDTNAVTIEARVKALEDKVGQLRTVRVTATNSSSSGNSLDFFVNTGNGDDAAIACIADNDHYPEVQALYARPIKGIQNKNGVHITIRLTGPAHGNALAVNIYQVTMPGDMTVIPLV